MKQQQSGFTLIELVIVIVVLGILAATAVPKFIGVNAEARAGVMRAVEGAMRSANVVIYAKAAAQGQTKGTNKTVDIDGAGSWDVRVNYGYASNADYLSKIMDLEPASDFEIKSGYIAHKGALNPATCQIAYTPATYNSSTGAYTPPVYTQNLTNCN